MRILAGLLTVIIALILAGTVRLVTLTPPDVTVRATTGGVVTLAGSAPTPAWPSSGQAALDVPNVGSLGASPDQVPTPTASLAKVMTAYLTLRKYPLTGGDDGFSLTVSAADAAAEHEDVAQDQSVVAVRAGEQLTERQLLEGLLIPSGDNIAQMLAVRVAGSVPAFVREMNDEAHSLGMTATTYTDPSGFAASTVSTATDQLKIFEQAMRSAVFRQIVAMPSVTLPVAGIVHNFDPLIADGYDGKTGSDSAAEGCLAFYKDITVAGRRVRMVGAVMDQGLGSTTSVILAAAGDAAADLVNSVRSDIRVHTLIPADHPVLSARSASGARTAGITTRALQVIGWGGLSEHLTVRTAPTGSSLTARQVVGAVILTGSLPRPATAPASTPVRVARALAEPGLGWSLSHLL